MRKAVIDIGTNSTRLYVADFFENKQIKILKMLSTTRLGEGILRSNELQPVPMERTKNAVKQFYEIAKEKGAEEIYIYATAVTREAKNKNVFSQMLYDETGITLDIIPGELEGEIAFLGAAGDYPEPAVIDIGGGSTEVVTKKDGILRAHSEKTGGVRLKEKFSTSSGVIDVTPVKSFVRENYLGSYKACTDILSAKTLIGVSGTPTTLLSLSMGLKSYEPDVIQGKILTKKSLDTVLEKLASMDDETRRAYSGEFCDRADIIVFGGCILSAFMEFYGFENIVISDRDSLEGYLELKEKTVL